MTNKRLELLRRRVIQSTSNLSKCPSDQRNYRIDKGIKKNGIGGLHITSLKHDYVNNDQFSPNRACKTVQHVSVANLKLFGPIKTELWDKEVREFSIMGKWVSGLSFAHHHGCHNINVWRFSQL